MGTADELIARLGLQPHPEGGHYRQTHRDLTPGGGTRGFSTAIVFLLKAGEVSWWHRIDATEVWHFYRGAPLELAIGKAVHVLGPDIEQGQSPQLLVPPGGLHAGRLHGGARLRVHQIRTGAEGFLAALIGWLPRSSRGIDARTSRAVARLTRASSASR